MKLLLFGYGNMGRMIEKCAAQTGHEILGRITRTNPVEPEILENSDVCIDFSHHQCLVKHIKIACQYKKPLVIGTTGWDYALQEIKNLILTQENAAVFSPNFSIGVAIFSKLVEKAGRLTSMLGYEAVGIEHHHSRKQDAPSGTAISLSKSFGRPITFSSLRCGHHPGKHTIVLDSENDSIILTHEARNRDSFAQGALQAAEWIINKKGWFTLDDMLGTLDGIGHPFCQ